MFHLHVLAATLLSIARAWDVANTPPLGFSTWNLYGCSVNATILMNTAQSMHNSGLQEVGYTFVNSDDCWMTRNRTSDGRQIADPAKFPDGFAAVTAFIHSLGLKSGLYTAKGTTTCDGFAASCDHEAIDAAQWAEWGIDYVKDDSCSNCDNYTDNELYARMWAAIEASGRPMVLTVEGSPDVALCSRGGYGNAKRVGHDINPSYSSMASLVDIGSGLWPYAHNSTNATFGGWWNDLDMLEVGNGEVDFNCSADAAALSRCQAHFSMWAIMKAPLILGNDISAMSPATLSVLANKEVIAINQDPLGVQARRVAVAPPAAANLTADPNVNLGVVAPCDAARPTQAWRWRNESNPNTNQLFLVPCNASDPTQAWAFVPLPAGGTALRNVGAGACVDAAGTSDPAQVLPCDAGSGTQAWALQPSGHIEGPHGSCLDVFNFVGPDVELGPCKVSGDNDANQVFALSATGTLTSASPRVPPGRCVGLAAGLGGGTLAATDAAGAEWCLVGNGAAEGNWHGAPCGVAAALFAPTGTPAGANASGPANYTLTVVHGGASGPLGINGQIGASGPAPHTR